MANDSYVEGRSVVEGFAAAEPVDLHRKPATWTSYARGRLSAGGAERIGDAGREHGQAEERSGGERGGDQIVAVEGKRGDVAGAEAGERARVHAVEPPAQTMKLLSRKNEVEEASTPATTRSTRGLLQDAHAEQADGGVPDPGDDVLAHLEGIP